MKRSKFEVGGYYHIYNRGVRGFPIVRDDEDRWRFVKMLYYFNDEFSPYNWKKEISRAGYTSALGRLDSWPEQKKLLDVVAFCLMENHFHLIAKEIQPGGISKFMRKLGIGLANSFNTKHETSGALFQGPYKLRKIDTDNDLKNLSVYVQVKNPFELYADGGIKGAFMNKEKAFEEALQYKFCSLESYAGEMKSPIISKGLLGQWFDTPQSYRDFALSIIGSRSFEQYSKIEGR